MSQFKTSSTIKPYFLIYILLSLSFNISGQDTIMARNLDLSPKAESFYNEGVKMLLEDKYEMAIGAFDIAIEMNNSFYKAYLNRGIAKMKSKDIFCSINDFVKCSSISSVRCMY